MSGPDALQDSIARGADSAAEETRAVLAGRVEILYRLGRHYLFLPFAEL